MLSCVPPKPCEPRSVVNHTRTHAENAYLAQHVISSSYDPIVINTNAGSTVNLYGDDDGPRVLASSGKLTGAKSDGHDLGTIDDIGK